MSLSAVVTVRRWKLMLEVLFSVRDTVLHPSNIHYAGLKKTHLKNPTQAGFIGSFGGLMGFISFFKNFKFK